MTKTTLCVDVKVAKRLAKLKVHGNQSYEELIVSLITKEEQRRKK